MILKVIILFLVGVGILAMFGKLKFPSQKRLAAARCKSCGRLKIGTGPCDCGRGEG